MVYDNAPRKKNEISIEAKLVSHITQRGKGQVICMLIIDMII